MSEAIARILPADEPELLDDVEAGELAVEFDDRPPQDLLAWAANFHG